MKGGVVMGLTFFFLGGGVRGVNFLVKKNLNCSCFKQILKDFFSFVFGEIFIFLLFMIQTDLKEFLSFKLHCFFLIGSQGGKFHSLVSG